MKRHTIDTPLGELCAIADEKGLYMLEFLDTRHFGKKCARLTKKTNSELVSGKTQIHVLIEEELKQFFKGKLEHFKTPLVMLGTAFQKRVWMALLEIPHGQTRSYAELAKAIGHPTAYRAVAMANAANPISVVVPCHRVINASGKCGGYGGGIKRKEWLLDHEKQ